MSEVFGERARRIRSNQAHAYFHGHVEEVAREIKENVAGRGLAGVGWHPKAIEAFRAIETLVDEMLDFDARAAEYELTYVKARGVGNLGNPYCSEHEEGLVQFVWSQLDRLAEGFLDLCPVLNCGLGHVKGVAKMVQEEVTCRIRREYRERREKFEPDEEAARAWHGAHAGTSRRSKPAGMDKERFTRNEANVLARDYIRDHATPQRRVTARELAAYLKSQNPAGTCSLDFVGKLPAWRAYQDECELRGLKGKKKRPRTVGFTKKIEATTGESDRELQRLIDEQQEDMEPSPLEDDPPDKPPRWPRQRKRM